MLADQDVAMLPQPLDIETVLTDMQQQTLGRDEAASQLLRLSSREPHPRAKAALLETSAKLVVESDPQRAIGLLRESFRLFPTETAGKILANLAADEPVFQRLYRLGNLVDATAMLAAGGPNWTDALLEAARSHIGQGHGRAAKAVLDRLLADAAAMPEAIELAEVADQQIAGRSEALQAHKDDLAQGDQSDRASGLVAYAELLLAGDEPLAEAAAALAEAHALGAPLVAVAPLWVEVARALGDRTELTKALACSLAAGEALPTRLQHADELANIAAVDRVAPQVALAALQVLTEADVDDTVALARLRAVEQLLSDNPELGLEQMRAAAVRDRDRMGESSASLSLAWVASQRGDWATAERHYRRVRTLAPQDTEAFDFFESLYRNSADHKRLLVALSQRIGSAEGRETVRIALEMAQLCEGPLESPDRAIEAYQRLLTVQPDHTHALEALQRINAKLGRWPAVRDALERQAQAQLAKVALDPRTKDAAIATLERLMALATDPVQLNDPAVAVTHARSLLEVVPHHGTSLHLAGDALRAAGRYAELATLLRRAATTEPAPLTRASHWLALGDVLDKWLGQPTAALEAWHEALSARPAWLDAQLRLRQAARNTGDSGAVLASLLDEIKTIVGSVAVDLDSPLPLTLAGVSAGSPQVGQLAEAAALAHARADGSRLAGRLYALALAADPQRDDLVAALISTWSTAIDGQNLVISLQRLVDAEASKPRKAALLAHLAAAQADTLSDLGMAAQTVVALQELAPAHPLVADILARAAAANTDPVALRRVFEPGTPGALTFAQRALDLAQQGQPAQRLQWFRAAAQCYETELQQHESAALALSEAVACSRGDSDDADATQTQELISTAERAALYAELRRVARLAGMRGAERLALEAQLNVASDTELRNLKLALVDLMVDAGEVGDALAVVRSLAEDALGDRAAADFLQAVHREIALCREQGGDDPETVLESLADLLGLAADDVDLRAAVAHDLTEVCLGIADHLSASEDRWPAVVRLTQIGLQCSPATQPLAPVRANLLDLQERAYAEQRDWSHAVATAEQLAAESAGGDQGAQAAALSRAAEMCADGMGDFVRSASLYRQAVAIQDQDGAAWAGLVNAVRALGDVAELALVLDAYLSAPAMGRDSRVRCALERAELASTLGETDPLASAWTTIAALAQVETLREGEETLLAVAAGQLDVPELGSRVAELLLPVFNRHGRRDEAIRCQEIIALHAPRHSDARISGLIAVADAVADDAPRQAFDALLGAMADAPERTDLLDRIVALADRVAGQARLQALLRGLAGLDSTGEFTAVAQAKRPAALAQLAQLAGKLGNSAARLEALTAWRQLDPTSVAVLQRLEELYEATGYEAGLAEVIAAQCHLGDTDARAGAWMRRAQWAGEADPATQLALLVEATQAIGNHADLWQVRLAVARGSGEPAAVADALGAALASPAGLPDKTEAVREMAAALQACGPDRAVQAAGAWLDLLDADVADDEAARAAYACLADLAQADEATVLALLDRLEPVVDARGDAARLDEVLALRAKFTADPAGKVAVLLRSATARETVLGDVPAAFRSVSDALVLAPDNEVVRAQWLRLAQAALAADAEAATVAAACETAAKGQATAEHRLLVRRLGSAALHGLAVGHARQVLLEGILADDPDDAAALEQLDALAAESGDARARLALLALRTARAERAGDPDRAATVAALWLQRGQIAAEADLADEAKTAFGKAIDSPDSDCRLAARTALAELSERLGDNAGAAAALLALRQDNADPEERVVLTLRAAGFLLDAGDMAAGRAALQSGLADAPTSAALHTALESVLRDSDDLSALVAHLDGSWSILKGVADEDRTDLAQRWLAAVEQRAGAALQTVEAAQRLFDTALAPQAAIDCLQRLSQSDVTSDAMPAWMQQTWTLLATWWAAQGDKEQELAARLHLASQAFEPAVAADNRRAASQLLEDLGEFEAALDQLMAQLDGGNWTDSDATTLLRLGDQLDRTNDVEEMLELAGAELSDGARRTKLQLQLAGRSGQRQDWERQLALAQRVLADHAGNAEALALRAAALANWSDAPWQAKVAHGRDAAALLVGQPGHGEALLALATLLLQEVDTYAEAESAAQGAAELDSAYASAAFALVAGLLPTSSVLDEVARLAGPADGEAWQWLQDRARASDDWQGLDALLVTKATHCAYADRDAALATWIEIADLRADTLGDLVAAGQALDQALALDGDHEAVLRLRLANAEAQADQPTVAKLCAALAKQTSDEESALLWLRRAQALQATGETDQAIAACELALAGDSQAVQAALLCGQLRVKAGQLPAAVAGLRAAAGALTGEAAGQVWAAVAQLAKQADDIAGWAQAAAACAQADVANPELAILVQPDLLQGAWLAEAVTAIAPTLHSRGAKAQALALRKRLAETATGADRLTARRGLALQAAADGDTFEAMAMLFEVARNTELPADQLPDVLGEALQAARDGEAVEDWIDRVADMVANGDVAADFVSAVVAQAAAAAAEAGQPDRGADLWDIVWEQQPEDRDARDAVLALRRDANDPQRLASSLERAVVFAGAADKPQLRVELAALKFDHLGRPREAVRLVQDVLAAEPANEAALALSERLADNPVFADEMLAFLEPHYRTNANWLGLERMLRKHMDRAKTAAVRSELAQALAELQQHHLAHAGDALQSLVLALQAEPRLTTLAAIEKLAQQPDDDEVLAKAYALMVNTQLRPEDRAAILERAAAVDRRRGDLAAAERRLRESIDILPQSNAAAEQLEALLDEQGRFADQVRLLRERAKVITDIDLRTNVLHRMGSMARTLSDVDAAAEAYRDLAALDPTDSDSRSNLVDLLRESGAPAALADALINLAKVTQDLAAKALLLCEAARMQGRDSVGEERAEICYQMAFDADPANDEAFVWLERRAHQNPRHLASLLDARAQGLDAGPSQVLVLRKLAHARRDAGDHAGACEALERALRDDRHNIAVIDELAKIAEAGRQWPNWVAATELRLANETRKDNRVSILAQLARVLISEMDGVVRAQPYISELQKIAPKDPAVRQVVAMLKSHSGDPAEAAAGLEQVLRETEDPQALLALHQQLAELYLGDLANQGKGIRELQKVLAIDPRRWTVRRRLCDLFGQRQSYEALAESLRQWLTQLDEQDERQTLPLGRGQEMVALMRELAEVLVLLGKPQEAAQQLKRAWSLRSDDPGINATLAPLLEVSGDSDLAAQLHDWLAQHHVADKKTAATHLSKAALLHERRGDLPGARDRFKKAMESAPGDDEATLGSARVCLALQEPDRAMRLFDAVARKPAGAVSQTLRADAQFGMGQCRLARNQRDQARACFEQALALVPGHKAAAEALLQM